jgi:hypothetical protein
VQSLENVGVDDSYQHRISFAAEVFKQIAADPLGGGLGASGGSGRLQAAQRTLSFDNGVLEILYSFGWVGGLGFLSALAWAAWAGLSASRRSRDPLSIAAVSAWTSGLALLISGNTLVNASGAFFWGMLGLAIASGEHFRTVGRQPSTTAAG